MVGVRLISGRELIWCNELDVGQGIDVRREPDGGQEVIRWLVGARH